MKRCKKLLVRASLVATLSTAALLAHAQEIYGGFGLPGLVGIGYSQTLNPSWGLRGEYSGGLDLSKDGVVQGVNVTGRLRAARAGLYADWHPFAGGFRLVGGLTGNDIHADLNSVGSGTATINGISVNMSGQTFNVAIKYPTTAPYLGLGWGHRGDGNRGLGFYSDIGVTFGAFTVDVNTSLVGVNGITQSDIDAQTQKMRDTLSQYNFYPSLSVGMSYRF
jgi:hypothetical protein